MPGAPDTSWFAKLAQAAKADPKKASVLAVLVLVMVVMWFRLLGGSSTPSAAMASPTASRGDTVLMPPLSRAAGARATSVIAMHEWAIKPLSPLSRNPFTINFDFFPQNGAKVPTLRAPQGDGFWDQLAKSMTARADQRKEHEVLVENLRLQAAQLKVQSTVMGPSPRALINGELLGVGDVVASFRVEKIEARRIVVEREGIKLELRF